MHSFLKCMPTYVRAHVRTHTHCIHNSMHVHPPLFLTMM